MNKQISPRFIPQIVAIALTLVIAFGSVGTFSVSAQGITPPTVSRYTDLPLRGQLIIPPGAEFVVPAELDGLVVTIWRGMADPTIQPVIDFSNSIAADRADRYGGDPSDYVTVIWSKSAHPLPGFTGRTGCDSAFDPDDGALAEGTSIGDSGCYEMIEYDRSEQSDFAADSSEMDNTPVYDYAYARAVCGERQVDSFNPTTGQVECQRVAVGSEWISNSISWFFSNWFWIFLALAVFFIGFLVVGTIAFALGRRR